MSFWSWLTGRDDIKEKSVVANFQLVDDVTTELKTIGQTGVGNAQDAVCAASDALSIGFNIRPNNKICWIYYRFKL